MAETFGRSECFIIKFWLRVNGGAPDEHGVLAYRGLSECRASACNETENSANHLELVRLGAVGLPATTAIAAEARTTPDSPPIDREIPAERESAKTS
jgi:hypothetical protein